MVNGLTANTTYVAYLVAVDTSGNTTAAVMSIAFITLVVPDTTAPTITSLSLSGTTASGTSIVASINESGTGYYVVLPSGSVAPSATQIRAGQNA